MRGRRHIQPYTLRHCSDKGGHLGQLLDKGDAGFALCIQLVRHALGSVSGIFEGLREGTRTLPQALVQEVAVHVGSQQGGADQVPQSQ